MSGPFTEDPRRSPSPVSLPVKPDDTLNLAEADYRFGKGRLRLHVTGVKGVMQLSDGPWLNLLGIEIQDDGSGGAILGVLVRLSAVRNLGKP